VTSTVERLHHRGDPQTAVDAAYAQYAALTDRQRQILSAVHSHPMTGPELCVLFSWGNNTPAKRLSDLKKMGSVEPTGETRRLPGQRPAAVYRVARGVAVDAWTGDNISAVLKGHIADVTAGRADSLRECPAWGCRHRDPFPSKVSFSRHLRAAHGFNSDSHTL